MFSILIFLIVNFILNLSRNHLQNDLLLDIVVTCYFLQFTQTYGNKNVLPVKMLQTLH